MKKSLKLTLTGTVHSLFFRQFVKENADKNDVRGFVRNLEDGRIEIFLEGDQDSVDSVAAICKRGPQHAQIRSSEEKIEYFQDFREFKILGI
ncbi:acylphosphatase [Candidatus Pacearchaeota archaeon]|nr:acylphosphatase [Candidatus Pacearchaeota archaeon]